MCLICLAALIYLPHLCHLVPKQNRYPSSFSNGNYSSPLQHSNFRLLLTATCWSLGNFIVEKKKTVGIAVRLSACFYLPDPPTLCHATVPEVELFSGMYYHSFYIKALISLVPRTSLLAEAG